MSGVMFLIFGIYNLFTLVYFGYDKRKAKKGKWRTRERTFFLMAFFGGAVGIWLGMKWFRHKTLHASFKYGIPLLLVWNLAFFYFVQKGITNGF